MKKIMMLLLSGLIVISVTGCSKNRENEDVVEEQPVLTMGEAMAAGGSWEYTEQYFKIVTDDAVYEADMTPEIYEKLEAVDFNSETRDKQYSDIMKDWKADKVTNRADLKLSEEQLAQYKGLKGQKLLDDGFQYFGSMLDKDKSVFYMEKDSFTYQVTTEEVFDPVDDFTDNEYIPEATIKEIYYFE